MSEELSKPNGAAHEGSPQDLAEVRALEAEFKTLTDSIMLARNQFMRQAGITFNGARDEYEILGYDRQITNRQYWDEYARGGIAGRIVDVMPDACWRGDPPFELIEDEDPEKDTAFEQAWTDLDTKHKICSKLLRVDKLSRLSTFATLLLGAKGNLEEELPRADTRGLLYVMPFSGGGGPSTGNDQRTTLAYDFGDCSVFEYDVDPASERFGLPKSYQLKRTDIASPTFARPVHYSRIIHVAEGLLADEVYGQPALERVWNLLIDLRKITGGGAEAFWLRANQGLHVDVAKDMSLSDTTNAIASLKEQAEAYKHQLTRWLRTKGVTVETLGSDVANFSNPADAVLTQIAGAKAVPKRILTGSEMGELASSQDRDNWKDQVNGRQMQHCAPNIIRPLADRLVAYGYLPTPAKGALAYQVSWSHIQVMTEDEKATGANTWMTTNQAAKNAGLQPVYTEAETRDHWYGMAPMSDKQKAEIEQAKKDAMALAQEMAPPAAPGPGGDLRAAEDNEMIRVLAAAIEAGNAEVVGRIIGLGDVPGHEFHGNQWTAGSGTDHPLLHEKFKTGREAEKAAKKVSLATGRATETYFSQAEPPGRRWSIGHTPGKSEQSRNPGETDDQYLRRIIGINPTKWRDKFLQAGPHAYATTQVQLPPDLAQKLLDYGQTIPDDDLYAPEGGRETDTHVTVCYGLPPNVDPGKLGAVLSPGSLGTGVATLGQVGVFQKPDYDVVYVAVTSQDLDALNLKVRGGLEVKTSDYPDYVPHATVAYVKPRRGAAYVGDKTLDGLAFTFDHVTMVSADGARTEVRLASARVLGDSPGHPFRGNQWTEGMSEASHPTHPLPDKPGPGGAAYQIADQEEGDLDTIVSMENDKTYYARADSFDFSAKTAKEMREQLKKYKARYIGWENK